MDSVDPATAQASQIYGAALRKLAPLDEKEASVFLREAALPAEESREKLLGFLVHEIRNPLATSIWAVEMLARKPQGEARSDRLAQLAARSVRRLRMLLEDLFSLERVPAHPQEGESDLRETLERAIAPHDIEPSGVHATVEGPIGIRVPVEASLLEKLLHACVRRLKHAGVEGPLSVRLSRGATSATASMRREGVTVEEVDPPLLTTGGSEGGGTTFALLVARAIAQRISALLTISAIPDGVELLLEIPLGPAAQH
jgi:signal transduction histidine kinase